MKLIVALALAASFILTNTAFAESFAQPAVAGPRADESPSWETRDWLLAPLSGTAAAAGAGLGLGFVGYQVDGQCLESTESCTPLVTAVAAYSGIVFGAASAVTLYGDSRGFGGSFRAAVLGAVIGNVGSGLPTVLAFKILGDDLGGPVALAAVFAFPAIGATIAYKISDRINARATAPRYGALIDVSDGGARLSVPAISFGVAQEAVSVYAPLAAGSF